MKKIILSLTIILFISSLVLSIFILTGTNNVKAQEPVPPPPIPGYCTQAGYYPGSYKCYLLLQFCIANCLPYPPDSIDCGTLEWVGENCCGWL